MNKDVKEKWVAALRSGVYKQTTGVLRNAEGYCCLGVLCDLHDPSRWIGQLYDDEGQVPPDDVRVAASFLENGYGYYAIPSVVIDGEQRNLVEHNDHGASFAQIADAIEAQL